MQDDEVFTAAEKERIFSTSSTWLCTFCSQSISRTTTHYCSGPSIHPSTVAFLSLLEDARELSLKKSRDYGTEDDPDTNLKNGQDFGLPNWVTIACRMDDKLSRIKTAARQRIQTGEVTLQNEGLRDAFLDLAVYSLKAIVRIDEEGV